MTTTDQEIAVIEKEIERLTKEFVHNEYKRVDQTIDCSSFIKLLKTDYNKIGKTKELHIDSDGFIEYPKINNLHYISEFEEIIEENIFNEISKIESLTLKMNL